MTYEIKYRREEEMKDSGIEWLGMIPRNWSLMTLRRVTYLKQGLQIARTERFIEDGKNRYLYLTIKYLNSKNKKDEAEYIKNPDKGVKCGKDDIILARTGATGTVVTDVEGVFHNNFFKVNYNEKLVKKRFLVYVLREKGLKSALLQKAGTTTIPDLNHDDFLNTGIVLPEANEQKRIISFLDHKTAEFDSIISKKELLIEKLEQAKKSLISEVVTGKVKILDGELVDRKADEMKDSAVDWLGMIPKDWEVKKLKYLSKNYPSNVDKKSYSGEEQVRLCNYVDVYYNDYITEDLKFMKASASKFEINRFTLKKGNILLTKDSESPDDIAIPSYVKENINNLICGYHLMIVKPFNKYISKYIYYQFLVTGIKNYFETVSNGVTRYGIGIGGFNNLVMALPKIEEQESIAKSLDIYNRKINSIITKTKHQIKKLKEAKQSLISEAVIGKIDLRDWLIEEI